MPTVAMQDPDAPPPGAVYMKNGTWLDKNDQPVVVPASSASQTTPGTPQSGALTEAPGSLAVELGPYKDELAGHMELTVDEEPRRGCCRCCCAKGYEDFKVRSTQACQSISHARSLLCWHANDNFVWQGQQYYILEETDMAIRCCCCRDLRPWTM